MLLSLLIAQSLLSPKDQNFLNDYNRNAAAMPDVGAALLESSAREPIRKIIAAQNVCVALESGVSFEAIASSFAQSNQQIEDPRLRFIAENDTKLTLILATRHYCPRFERYDPYRN